MSDDNQNRKTRIELMAEPGFLCGCPGDEFLYKCIEEMQLKILRRVGPKRKDSIDCVDAKWIDRAWRIIDNVLCEKEELVRNALSAEVRLDDILPQDLSPERLLRFQTVDDECRQFHYLRFDRMGDGLRLVACVDDLGEAKGLVLIDDCTLVLTTDRGVYRLDRRAFEPAYSCGFVSVEMGKPNEGLLALYFDPRIAAALHKRGLLWAMGDVGLSERWCGKEIALPTRDAAWTYLKKAMIADTFSLRLVCSELTWVDMHGQPIMDCCELGALDGRLWRFFASFRPDEDELRDADYREHRQVEFLASRTAHSFALAKLR